MKYNDQGFYDNDSGEFQTDEFDTGLEPPFEPAYEPPYKKFEQPNASSYEPTFGQTFEKPFGQSFEEPFEQSFEEPFEQSFEKPFEKLQSFEPTAEEPFGQSFEQPEQPFNKRSRASIMAEFEQPLNPNAEPEEDWEERRAEERRRAAIRRRKMEARERRRKKRMIQAITRCSILLLIVILILVGFIKMISGAWKLITKDKKSHKTTEQIASTEDSTETPAPKIDKKILAQELPADKDAALAIIKELGEENTDMKSIYDNAAIYPDKIIRYLAANPELIDFVMNYPAKISVVFDGEFDVTVSEKKVPLFLQYDEQWGYADYGNEIIATDGSAPTCLSMAYTYLLQDGTKNPIRVADYAVSKGYLGEDGVTSEKLMTDGATDFGMTSEELPLEKKAMKEALESGKLIICRMKEGDFTKDVQYILIYKYKDGLYYLNDPSSAARSDVPWAYDRLSTQIDKMWVLGK